MPLGSTGLPRNHPSKAKNPAPAGHAPSANITAALAKPAPEYELVLMLDPEVPDERRDAIASEARQRIEGAANLKQERSWGLRKMAYEIDRRNEADYRFFRFGEGKAVLDELNHNLKITDGVLRFRIFKVDADAPVVDPPPPISLAASGPPRSGGRRRDDDRPPRGPEPESSAGEAAPPTSGDTEPPAATDEAAEPSPAPAAGAEAPLETASAPQPAEGDEQRD